MLLAKKYHVDKMYYYHLRDMESRPVVTVCIVKKGDCYGRGLSICSKKDMPVKAKGRTIARNRALRAVHNQEFDGEINRFEANEVLCETIVRIDRDTLNLLNFKFKTEFNPELTNFERKLFKLE